LLIEANYGGYGVHDVESCSMSEMFKKEGREEIFRYGDNLGILRRAFDWKEIG
jgi:hypothetical protein